MKYTTEIIVNKPLKEVIDLFKNADNLKHWQRGLKNTTLIKGISGQKGAKRKLVITIEGREIVMIETITKCELPQHWHARYTTTGLVSLQENYFELTPNNYTYWKTSSKFRFEGYMKIVGRLLPSMFKKRSKIVMQDFKRFAETGHSVSK